MFLRSGSRLAERRINVQFERMVKSPLTRHGGALRVIKSESRRTTGNAQDLALYNDVARLLHGEREQRWQRNCRARPTCRVFRGRFSMGSYELRCSGYGVNG